jgi:site-specific recombinase XerD
MQEPVRGNSDVLFPNARGGRLSSDGMAYILSKHLTVARQTCPSLKRKRVTPHVLRHTAAMELLQAGVDTTVIALWLGHESVETTNVYLAANLALKEKALAKTTPHGGRPGRYRPDAKLMGFLNSL